MSGTIVFDIAPDGVVRYIYSPAAIRLAAGLGKPTIKRASSVEPDAAGQWWVDLHGVDGPILGPYPPDARDQAIADEVAWLLVHHLHYEADSGEDNAHT
jgi:hypothetical protein